MGRRHPGRAEEPGAAAEQDCLTVSGRTIGEIVAKVPRPDDGVIRPLDDPIAAEGGIAVLKGTLAPDGAVVKQGAIAAGMMSFTGTARVFESEDDAMDLPARGQGGREGRPDHPQRRPEGRPGHARVAGSDRRRGRLRAGRQDRDRHRRALLGRHAQPLDRPRLARGGRLRPDRPGAGRRRDRDRPAGAQARPARDDEELRTRKAAWQKPAPKFTRGWLARYSRLVSSAANGAVLE